jgi:hypothetical protein
VGSAITWIKGLGAAILGGAIASVVQAAQGGGVTAAQIKAAALAGAAIAVAAYFKQPPASAGK